MIKDIVITKEFFLENATENGAWTSAQVKILGLKFPLESGWQEKLIGTKITQDQAKEFAKNKNVFVKRKKRKPDCK